MKIHLDLPWGTFEYERDKREPLTQERFYAVCAIVGGIIFAAFVIIMFKG